MLLHLLSVSCQGLPTTFKRLSVTLIKHSYQMLLNIIVVSCSLWNINWANVCPFPGIPANGYGNVIRNDVNQTIAWKSHPHFNPGERVDYYCRHVWKKPQHVNRSLFCQEDGTWTGNTAGWRGGLPRCGNNF